MIGFIFKRMGQAVVVMLGVIALTLLMVHLLPNGPARSLLGDRATQTAIKSFNHEYGFDRNFFIQYWDYLWQIIVKRNLGHSIKLNQGVASVLAHDIPKTFVLVGTAVIISIIIAIPIGVWQAVKRNRAPDVIGTAVSFTLYAFPTFFLGQILIYAFAVRFNIFPAEAPQGSTITSVLSQPSAMVLPIVTLVLAVYASYTRYMRSSALDALAQDWMRTAKAKGLSNRVILFKHMLRNALIPIATLIGLSIPGIFTAGLIIEDVFNYPGLGLEYFNAAVGQDFPLMLGITWFIAFMTVLGNLIADIGYAILDPRVRY